jgi:hypothetical protein
MSGAATGATGATGAPLRIVGRGLAPRSPGRACRTGRKGPTYNRGASLALVTLVALASSFAAAPDARAELPPRTVLVMDLRAAGVDDGTARTIQSTLITELDRVPGLDILSGDDVRELVKLEASRQASGCDVDGSCLAEIAGALGAQLAIFGDVGKLGALTVVNLSLFDTKAAMSTSRARAETDDLAKIGDALVDALPAFLAPALTAAQLDEYKRDIDKRRSELRNAGLLEKKGPPVYVVDPRVVNMAPAVAATVSALVAETATTEGMAVFTRDDARLVLEREADLQTIGAESDGASLTALGKKVGAGHVIACVVSAVDDDVLVSARLIDVAKSAVVSRRAVRARDFGGSLIETVRAATRLVLQPVFAADKGALTVTSTEEGANVFIDDALVGTTPLREPLQLPGGHHLLAIEKQGFIRVAEALRVERGAQLERHVRLLPSVEFLEEYRATNGLLRTLAWTSTAAAGVTGVVAGASWGMYFVELAQLDDVIDKYDGVDFVEGSQQQRDADAERAAAVAEAEAWRYPISIAGTAFLISAAAAGAFWIIGDDPARYDDLGQPAAP